MGLVGATGAHSSPAGQSRDVVHRIMSPLEAHCAGDGAHDWAKVVESKQQ
jgi:hypothetical protein